MGVIEPLGEPCHDPDRCLDCRRTTEESPRRLVLAGRRSVEDLGAAMWHDEAREQPAKPGR